MTAQIVELFPTGEQADDTIRRTVDALITGKGMTRDDVAAAINMSRSTFYAKMAGKGSAQAFKGGEVASLAKALGEPVAKLYDGFGGTFVPPRPPDGGDNADGFSVRTSKSQPTLVPLSAVA